MDSHQQAGKNVFSGTLALAYALALSGAAVFARDAAPTPRLGLSAWDTGVCRGTAFAGRRGARERLETDRER
jgi:hypothetical protein